MGPEFQNISAFDHVSVDLRYASTNNFTGENLYGQQKSAFLHAHAAEKLRKAAQLLHARRPGHRLLILDALRPRSVQRRLWAHVKGTPEQIYVADPDKGSIHNFGLAVDLTICDALGFELDMGTPFDSFQELAQPRHEEEFLKLGKLTAVQVENRKLLREVMVTAGFSTIPHEWWHFNATDIKTARENYKIVE